MGKSNFNYEKGMPKRNPKDNDEDDFDWREELRKREVEEKKDDELENNLSKLDSKFLDLENDYMEEE